MSRRLNENYYKEDEKRRKRKDRKERIEWILDDVKDALEPVAIFLGVIIISTIVLAAIICPLIYYGDQLTTIKIFNTTDEQYAYIVNGSEHLNVKYDSEKRYYNGTISEITMITNGCWNAEKIITKFLDLGSISYEK